jgi:hypothetical protein
VYDEVFVSANAISSDDIVLIRSFFYGLLSQSFDDLSW